VTIYKVVVHKRSFSGSCLILGSSCAVGLLGLVVRLFGTSYMIDDRKLILRRIDETLDMQKLVHLAPSTVESNCVDTAQFDAVVTVESGGSYACVNWLLSTE